MSFELIEENVEDIVYNQNILNIITDYLRTNRVIDNGQPVEEQIKGLCIKKLCESIGIKCNYNVQNIFFNFFASIAGEAVAVKLQINIKVDKLNLKCFKFNNVNIIHGAIFLLDNKIIDEAIIDIYELADRYKWIMGELAY